MYLWLSTAARAVTVAFLLGVFPPRFLMLSTCSPQINRLLLRFLHGFPRESVNSHDEMDLIFYSIYKDFLACKMSCHHGDLELSDVEFHTAISTCEQMHCHG